MNNELYYNKYLFQQSGGRNIPVSTYDQMEGYTPQTKSDNIIDAAKDLALTAANAVGVIASKFAQKGLKEGTKIVDEGLDQALALDPNKTLKDQAAEAAAAIKEKGQLAVAVIKNSDFQAGIKDVAQASGTILDTVVEEMQPVIDTAIETTGETLEKNGAKIAETGVNVVTGSIMAAADVVPGLGPAIQVANTVGGVIGNVAQVARDTSNTLTEITGEANNAAQTTIGATQEAQSKLTEASNRITQAIDEVTTMIEKGKDSIKKEASLNDLKKSAKIASKTAAVAAGGGKTRKRKKRRKTRRKRRKRNKSKKGRKSRKN